MADARPALARALAALTLLMALLAGLVLAGPVAPAHADESGVIAARLNEARAANGLGALRRNGSLDAVAAAWAAQMAANGTLSHNPSYSSQIPGGWTRAGENVAQGYPSGSAMHDGWWNSSGHRANMLGAFTDVGIAFLNAGGTTWGVQVFATYGALPAAPAPARGAAPAPGAASGSSGSSSAASRAAADAAAAEAARLAAEAEAAAAAEAARIAEEQRVRAEALAAAQAAEEARIAQTREVVVAQERERELAEAVAMRTSRGGPLDPMIEADPVAASAVGALGGARPDTGVMLAGLAGLVVLAGGGMLVPGIRRRVNGLVRRAELAKAIQVTER